MSSLQRRRNRLQAPSQSSCSDRSSTCAAKRKRGNSLAHPDPGTPISRSCTATVRTLHCRAHNTHTPPWPPSLAPPSTPPKMLCAGQLQLQPARPAGVRAAAVRAVATPLAQKPWPLPCLPCPSTCMHDSLHDPAPRPPCPAPSRPPAAPPLRAAAAPRCRRLPSSIAAARRPAAATAAARRAARGQPAAPTHRTRWCLMVPSRASAQRPAASSGRCGAGGSAFWCSLQLCWSEPGRCIGT